MSVLCVFLLPFKKAYFFVLIPGNDSSFKYSVQKNTELKKTMHFFLFLGVIETIVRKATWNVRGLLRTELKQVEEFDKAQ